MAKRTKAVAIDGFGTVEMTKLRSAIRQVWQRSKQWRIVKSRCQDAKDNGISISTYSGRESGMRPYAHEEYLVLAQYFDRMWKKKFDNPEIIPLFQNIPIERVTVQWLMFGVR